MIDYSMYENDEDFMDMLDYVRANCLIDKDQLSNETDFDTELIEKHFDFIQAIVSEEIEEGELHDAFGSDIAKGYIDSL